MKKKVKKNVRSYKVQTFQTEKKQDIIFALYNEYKKYYKYQINKQYRIYQKIGFLNKNIDTKKDKSLLSERYRRNVVFQAVGQLNSWLSNRDNKIKDMIHQCDSLSDNEKRMLHIIRRSNIFEETTIIIYHSKNDKKKGLKKGELKEKIFIPKKYIQIYKSILRIVNWRLSSNKNIGMQLNANVCQFVKKKRNHNKKKALLFDHWFELSTLTKGKKVLIPSLMNDYLQNKLTEEKLLNSVRIDFKNNKLIFNIMIDKKRDEDYESKIEKIGIDFGTKNLFAISTGNIFGVNFGKQLKYYDDKITILQKRLQKQKIKPRSSKRYRRLVFKC